MVPRARVATCADVPVVGPGGRAGAGCSLIQGRNQRDHVLLIQGPRTERANRDVEPAILPEHIVRQNRVRVPPASSIVRRGARIVACRTGDSCRQVRNQGRTVLDGHQAGRFRRRRRDAGLWRLRAVRTRPLTTSQRSSESVEEHTRGSRGVVRHDGVVDDVRR